MLREQRARAREEQARMAAAEGPLARIADLARARTKSRTTGHRGEPRHTDRPHSGPASARPSTEARQLITQSFGEADAPDESQESMERVDSVTEQIALQQEIEILRRMLGDKERILDETATQCRSLEDELEDQHLAHDGLKRALEQEKLAVAAEREQAARVRQERDEVEERYQALLESKNAVEVPEDHEEEPTSDASRSATPFFGGLAAGGLLAAIAFGLWLQLDPLSAPGDPEAALPAIASTQSPPAPEAPAKTAPVAAAPPETEPDDRTVAESVNPRPAGGEEGSGPAVLGTLRDRLSDGSSGPLMVKLRGGGFTMGKQRALPDNDEGPPHDVRLGGFLIGSTEVTFEEYDRFVRATGGRSPSDFGWGRGRRPVVGVSWDDARAYARWLSGRTGRRYRLPSEAEWEYAAAAGERSSFWWGYKLEPNRAVCFDCGSRWDNLSSAPVKTFDPNPLGLYDTAGNVLEWVQDCYHPNYTGAPANGQPRGGESCRFRVARGGAFNKPARSMRTTARNRLAPDTRINSLGFRLARDE